MLDDIRFPHVRVPKFLNVRTFPGLTPSIFATYAAARSFAYLRSRSSERFSRCWPAIRTIGEVLGQGDSVVKRNLSWLEAEGLIYRQRRFNQSSVITFVDFPDRFRQLRDTSGLQAAIDDNEGRLEELVDQAHSERAEKAHQRPTENKYPRTDSTTAFQHSEGRERSAVNPGGVASGLSGVYPRPTKNTRSEEQKKEEHDLNRFAAEGFAHSMRELLKNKGIETTNAEEQEARLQELRRQAETLQADEKARTSD